MAKNKKSKILAMALCASVMAGIYASPVFAEELWKNNAGTLSTVEEYNNKTHTKVTNLEGLEEIKVGTATDDNGLVKVSDDNGGLVRVGESGGQNVRVTSDGIYLNNNGAQKTSGLTANALTLAGNTLTSAQLANINSVIGADQEVNASRLNLNGIAMNADTNGDTLTVGNSSLSFAKANETITNTEAIRRVVGKEHKMSATYLEETVKAHSAFGLQVLDENGEAVATISRGGSGTFNGMVTTQDVNSNAHSVLSSAGLQLYNADGTSKVNITNTGASRFGAFDETSVRIENGQLQIRAANTAENADSSGPLLASLSEKGLTLVDANRKYSTLTAAQLANLNSTIKEGGVVDANELNVSGKTGGLYIKNVTNEDGETGTMIFAGLSQDGDSTLRIDPKNGNLSTKGTIGVADNNWHTVTQIQGSGENIGDIAVGINYNTDGTVAGANIILDADTGNVVAKGGITAADFNDVTLVKNGEQVLVGGIDISALKEVVDTANDAVGGIRRSEGAGEPGTGTTTIEKATSFDANGMRVTNENDGRAVEITKDRGIEVFGGNDVSNAVIARNGTARFGAEAGLNVSIKNGDVTSTYYDEEGKVGHYSLNNIGDKTQNMWANGHQTNFSHSVNVEGSFSSGNGAVNLKGNWGEEASIELRDAKDKTYTLTATQLGNINNMITGAGVLENVVSINGAAVKGVGDGGLKISEVRLEKGGIWADKLNGRLISEYVTDDEISGDLENIGGIDRKDVTGEGKPGEGTTTIENLLNVSGDSVSASLGNNSFTFDNSGFKFTGVVNLGSASDIYFNYGGVGNGTDYAGSYTLEDLADTVADIYDRTQAIDYENGKTTIKGDLDVVKDPNAGSGEGGDPGTGEGGNTGNGNGHYDGNLDVDGGITAGDSTIGDVGLEGGTVTADKVVNGNTTLDNEGLNVGGQTSVTADGVNVGGNGGTTVSKDGVSIADKTIISDHDVVINEGTADRVSLSETADRVGNLEQGVSELNNRVGELEDRIDKVGAMAAAIANLRTMGYDPAAPTEVAVGIGQYRDETGAALGLFHYPNRDFMLSLSVSTSGDEVMGGIGATWKFGRKSPEKVAEIKKAQAEADARRAEEAKLAKAEEMKQAAKEAKIKAQQERHAKLAAERAAQAEAAK